MLTPTTLFDIRATRSSPPGYAGENPERRGVYGAALAQFDELISSAESVGPAARPLPLFYALSQAGRAIAAAHAVGAWRLRAHGLSATELSHTLLEMPILSDPLQDSGPDVTDSLSALAAATGSDMFAGSVSIGELWASLPELCSLLPEEPQIRPLLLVPEGSEPENIRIRTDPSHLYGVIVADGSGEDLEALLHTHYPGTELYPEVVDACEEEGGVPSRLIKTDAGDGRQEGTPCQMFAGSPSGRMIRVRSRSMISRVRALGA